MCIRDRAGPGRADVYRALVFRADHVLPPARLEGRKIWRKGALHLFDLEGVEIWFGRSTRQIESAFVANKPDSLAFVPGAFRSDGPCNGLASAGICDFL